MRIYSLIGFLIIGANTHAQVDFHNTGILYISGSSDILHVSGSFTNAAGSSLTNAGNLYVLQNLTNNQSSMSVGTGTLYLNGSQAQFVNGSEVFRTFNLETNNTHAGGITLNNNLSISGSHSFVDGIISTSATPNYLVYEAGSSYTGDGDGQHVSGWVKKIGNTDFSFPVGNGTVIRKTAIESLSGSLEFNAHYFQSTQNLNNLQAPLVLVDPQEYWIINRVSVSGSAQVHLNWDNSRVAFPQFVLNSIRGAYYSGAVWVNQGGSATGDVNTTGDIISNTVSAFGELTFGSVEFLLPLRFLGIIAHRKMGYNLVEWKTADATNTDHFDIERSEDGVHYKTIGKMSSVNAPTVLTYTFRDDQLTGGTLWYRIRSVDVDGRFNLSAVVAVRAYAEANQSMHILNNPAQGSIHLYAPESYRGECRYNLSSTNGQLIQKGVLSIRGSGNASIELSSKISPGVYILQVRKDKQQFQQKILIR